MVSANLDINVFKREGHINLIQENISVKAVSDDGLKIEDYIQKGN